VAHPSPYRPGSEVSILTITSGIFSGEVKIVRIFVIVIGFDMRLSL